MSLNLSGSAEPPPFPWLYPYQDDGPRLGAVVQRPIVSAALAGSAEASSGVYALVDSGCCHTLAAPWMADAAGVNPDESQRILTLGIGGGAVRVRFLDLRVRLIAPGGSDEDYIEWETEVGFPHEWKPTWPMLLGQIGFLDKFTVTTSQFARQTAVEAVEAFDERFGIPTAPPPR